GNPQQKEYKEKGVIDSGCSRHMTGKKCYLSDCEDYDGGFVSFGYGKGRISGKGKIKTGTLDFDDVYFFKEIKYNLLSVSQMCDKKNNVLFTDTECLVLSSNFKLFDESQVLLRVLRKDNIYNVDLKSFVPTREGCNERKNRTLIEAARTMLVNSKFPTTFWAEAVNTACYVLNRALVIKPHNKTPYELIHGRPPQIDFMKPFRCLVTILYTRDSLEKFDGKANEGFFVGYSMVSKAMRVFNKRTRIVEESLNIRFLKNAPNVKGNGSYSLFDIDSLTISINYEPVVTRKQTNGIAGTKDNLVAGQAVKKKEPEQEYILIPICITDPLISQGPKDSAVDDGKNANEVDESRVSDNGGQYDQVTRNHPKDQVISSIETPVQTRQMTKINKEHGLISLVQKLRRTNHKDFQNCLFAFYLSQMEPKKLVQALKDPSWVEAMQDELLQFKLLKVWTLVDLPKDKWAIGTKWVFRNKKDERRIMVKNKARLVTQGHTQEEGIDYDEVFAPVARIEAIRLILAYACFKDFIVYQMDVKSAFLYGHIEEEVYVYQPPDFEDPNFPDQVYNVEKALYGPHKAPRAWYKTLLTYLMDNGFHKGQVNKTLFIQRHKDDILLVQVYVDDIIFGSTKK
nr:hypothetical protein [Tanacetum cinerariifolium]